MLGVSTRKVESLVEAMGAQGMSKSEVLRMAAELDEQVTEFRERPIEEAFPYLWLDAVCLKVRQGGRVVSKAALVAYGVSVVGIFPNNASAVRLLGMLLAEQNDEWAVGRRYFSLASMAEMQPQAQALPDAV